MLDLLLEIVAVTIGVLLLGIVFAFLKLRGQRRMIKALGLTDLDWEIKESFNNGGLAAVQRVLDKEPDPDRITLAELINCFELSEELVSLLIEYGVSKECVNSIGDSLLIVAYENERKDLVDLLLYLGADIDRGGEDGDALLHRCASYGDDEMCSLFLEKGADCNVLNNDCETPLIVAVKEEKAKIVELLMAMEDIDVNLKDKGKRTALQYAEELGNDEIVGLIKGG